MGWHDGHPIWDGLESIPDYSTTPFTIKCMKGSVTITASNRSPNTGSWAPSATHRGTDNTVIWSGTLSTITLQEGERVTFGAFPMGSQYGGLYYSYTKISVTGSGRAKAYGHFQSNAYPYSGSSMFEGAALYDVSRVWLDAEYSGSYLFDGLKNIKITPIIHQISNNTRAGNSGFKNCTGLREAWMLCGYDGWRADLALPDLPEGTNAVLHGNSAVTPVLPTGWIYAPIQEINAPGAYMNPGLVYYKTDSQGNVTEKVNSVACEFRYAKKFYVATDGVSYPSTSKVGNVTVSLQDVGSKRMEDGGSYLVPSSLNSEVTVFPNSSGQLVMSWQMGETGPADTYRGMKIKIDSNLITRRWDILSTNDIYDTERQWKYW